MVSLIGNDVICLIMMEHVLTSWRSLETLINFSGFSQSNPFVCVTQIVVPKSRCLLLWLVAFEIFLCCHLPNTACCLEQKAACISPHCLSAALWSLLLLAILLPYIWRSVNVCDAFGGDRGWTQNTESQPLSLSRWWCAVLSFQCYFPPLEDIWVSS